MDDNIYAPLPELRPGVEHSGERINGYHSRNGKLFIWIEHSGIRQGKM